MSTAVRERSFEWDYGAHPDLGAALSEAFEQEFGAALSLTEEAARFEATGESSLSDDWWPADAWPSIVREECPACGRRPARLDGRVCSDCERHGRAA